MSRPLLQPSIDRAGHLGFVAHEVRNPLSTALWSAELLGRLRPDERAGERGLKLATLGARALTRLQGLVEDHLLCERLDAGGYPLRLGPVDPGALLVAVLQKLQLDPAPTLSLEKGLGGQGDRALLERALEGLVAVAARGGAAVRIGAERAGGMVRLSVQGAPVESLEDPVRGSPSDPTGRALSLPLARRVAMVLGGSLIAQGSEYLLVFPAT
jgi:signal transduction histidine kinase